MDPVDTDTLFSYVEFNDAAELQDALKDGKVNPNCTNTEGWTLLHMACKIGTVECVKVMTKDARTNVNVKGPERITPLHMCIEHNNLRCLKILLEHPDINVNICDANRRTPLHLAVLKGNIDCFKLLLTARDINTDFKDADGKTVSDLVLESTSPHRKEIMKILGIEEDRIDDKKNNKEVKVMPVDPNLPENKLDKEGYAPLHYAARDGNVAEVKRLLAIHGIDVNIKNNGGWTALHYAARSGRTECVKLLLAHPDINVNIKNSQDRTPLTVAKVYEYNARNKQEIMSLLRQHGGTN